MTLGSVAQNQSPCGYHLRFGLVEGKARLVKALIGLVDPGSCTDGSGCTAQIIAELPEERKNFEGVTLLDGEHILLVSDNGDKRDP